MTHLCDLDLLPRGNSGKPTRCSPLWITVGEVTDWTVLRPGLLLDEPGTGLVRLGEPFLPPGTIPRDDVAAVLLALLDTPSAAGHVLELATGDTPIHDALRSAVVR